MRCWVAAARVRRIPWLVALALLAAAPVWWLATAAFVLRADAFAARVTVPYTLLIVPAVAAVQARVSWPVLWDWETGSRGRSRVVAVLTCLSGLVLAAGLLGLAALAAVRAGAEQVDWFVVDGMVAVAAIWLLAPFLGPLLTGAGVVVLLVGCGYLTSLNPEWAAVLPWTFRTDQPGPVPTREGLALVLCVAAILAHAGTRSATGRTHRARQAEE